VKQTTKTIIYDYQIFKKRSRNRMKRNDLIELIDVEDLTPDMKLIAEESGIETVRELFRSCEGLEITIPRINYHESVLIKYVKNRQGISEKILAKEIGRPLNYVRQLLSEVRKGTQRAKASF
jgi:hypothetical protein